MRSEPQRAQRPPVIAGTAARNLATLLRPGVRAPGGHHAVVADRVAGDDVHAVGSLAPIIEGHIGCIGIRRTAAVTWPV